jgi:hypothetical protein
MVDVLRKIKQSDAIQESLGTVISEREKLMQTNSEFANTI